MIFKSCLSLQFIAISTSSIIINKSLYTAQQISYLHPVYTLFVITRGFVSLHNSAMNKSILSSEWILINIAFKESIYVCDTLLNAA